MHDRQQINDEQAQATAAASANGSSAIRMKAESEYPDISMSENEQIMMQQGPCVEHKKTIGYHNADYEIYAAFLNGERDPEIKAIDDEAKKNGGTIKDIFIEPHIDNSGPGERLPPDPEGVKKYINDYVAIMSNAGVSTKGVHFHYRTHKADPCLSCDGFGIDVTVTYTTCN